jgi:Domain of unknown function (DUF397)
MEDQIDPRWRKATYSGNGGGNCVEVGQSARTVLVRDTRQDGHGPVLRISAGAWLRFTESLRD